MKNPFSDFVDHYNQKHNQNSKDLFMCPLCSKADFENLNEVKEHVRTLHESVEIKTDTEENTRLKRKKYLMKKENAIQCDYCSKLFNHKSNLKYHVSKRVKI